MLFNADLLLGNETAVRAGKMRFVHYERTFIGLMSVEGFFPLVRLVAQVTEEVSFLYLGVTHV